MTSLVDIISKEIISPLAAIHRLKIILIKNTYFIFSSKKTYHLNINNGKIMETKLPNKINPKELGIVLDEFQININSIPSSDAGYMYIGDAGVGGDFGGGDAGGGGGDGG